MLRFRVFGVEVWSLELDLTEIAGSNNPLPQVDSLVDKAVEETSNWWVRRMMKRRK